MPVINLSEYGYKPNFHRVVYDKIIKQYPELAKWSLSEFYEEGFYYNLNYSANRINIEIRNIHDTSFLRQFRPIFKFSPNAADLLIGGHDFWLRWFGMEKAKTGNSRDDKVALFDYLKEAYGHKTWLTIENMSNYSRIRMRSTSRVTDNFDFLYDFIPVAVDYEPQLIFNHPHYKNMETFRDLTELLARSQRGTAEGVYFASTANYVG